MADFTYSPNLWVGEWTNGVAKKAIYGGDTFRSGLFRFEDNIKGDKAIIRTLNYSAALVLGRVCNTAPTNNGSMSDVEVDLVTFSIVERFCKDSFINTSYADGQRSGILNSDVPAEVLAALVSQIAAVKMKQVENVAWVGVAASDGIDGIVTQLLNTAGVIRVTPAAGALTAQATVIAELNKVVAQAPIDIRFNPKFGIVVSPEVLTAYQAALAANQSYAMFNLYAQGGIANTQTNKPSYVGNLVGTNIPMYVVGALAGSFAQTAIGAILSNDIEGNFCMVTDLASDKNQIIVQDRSLVFIADQNLDLVWSFKFGVHLVHPTQAILSHP